MLLLNKIKVENVNALNGIVHGIPAITGFLGFVHALQRKTNIKMDSVAIIFHEYELRRGVPAKSVIHEGSPSSNRINEHIVNSAYIDFTVSLLINCDIENKSTIKKIKGIINTMRIAGGIIASIDNISIESGLDKLNSGFILLDKSADINKYEGADNLDKMIRACESNEYIPLAVGFRKLSDCSNTLKNTRDISTPSVFVEQIYGLGKFISINKINTLDNIFWTYDFDDNNGLFICRQKEKSSCYVA